MKRLIAILVALLVLLVPVGTVSAGTTADVTIYATPQFISITVDPASYNFSVVTASDTPSTVTNYFTIDNTSSVQTDQTISVTSTNWTGGVQWIHDDTCTPDVDTAGLKANKGGEWGGASDVIVKYDTPNYIAEDQTADTDYDFGLKLWAPTEFGDGVEKSIVVRVSAAPG